LHCDRKHASPEFHDPHTITDPQRLNVFESQVKRINHELASRRAATREEHPAWLEHLPPSNHPDYAEALNKTLLWRAVGNIDHPTSPLGDPPSEQASPSVKNYYHHARRIL